MFLLANIDLEIVLEMLFIILSKADIRFAERELVWRTYTATKALSTTRRVEIIDKRVFTTAVLNADEETFIGHVAVLAELINIPINPLRQAQVTALMGKETGILTKYSDFSNVFSSDSAAELPEYNRIYDHSIDLLDDK